MKTLEEQISELYRKIERRENIIEKHKLDIENNQRYIECYKKQLQKLWVAKELDAKKLLQNLLF